MSELVLYHGAESPTRILTLTLRKSTRGYVFTLNIDGPPVDGWGMAASGESVSVYADPGDLWVMRLPRVWKSLTKREAQYDDLATACQLPPVPIGATIASAYTLLTKRENDNAARLAEPRQLTLW